MIVIINYGAGNIGSIVNMFKRIGEKVSISTSPEDILNADKLILPGVGSFDYGMKQLHELGYVDLLNRVVLEKKVPILGVCLGAQLMTKSSEEGLLPGLGWFNAVTVNFFKSKQSKTEGLKIPHMGWSNTFICKETKLFNDLVSERRFYYVHSYHIDTDLQDEVLCTANYGYNFIAGLQKENIYCVQFHPEKSHKFGMELFNNFAKNI